MTSLFCIGIQTLYRQNKCLNESGGYTETRNINVSSVYRFNLLIAVRMPAGHMPVFKLLRERFWGFSPHPHSWFLWNFQCMWAIFPQVNHLNLVSSLNGFRRYGGLNLESVFQIFSSPSSKTVHNAKVLEVQKHPPSQSQVWWGSDFVHCQGKNVRFFFVCYFLSVMLLNGKVGANDFAIKVFDHGKAFNIVG